MWKLILIVCLISCGVSGTPFQTIRIDTTNTDDAYRAAVQAMAANSQTIVISDKDSGSVIGDWQDGGFATSQFRIRVSIGNVSTVDIDCRDKDPLTKDLVVCTGQGNVPSNMAATADRIARSL